MKYFFGHPDDPSNPQLGMDIDNDQLEELESKEYDNSFQCRRENYEPTGDGDISHYDCDPGL